MDRSWRSLRFVVVSALFLAAGIFSEEVWAEEDYRITNEVVLSDVRVPPAKAGGWTRITFLLENRSAERVSFGGIAVAHAGQSRIVASLGNGSTTILGSISVAPGEVLSVDGEVLWIEVDGLTEDLRPGEEVEANVSFGTAAIPISLTVEERNRVSN
ncbi:hypothetical protein [Microvirga makkahensis]|uniref:Copper chaperone PCu(A)C n=1 Tax=Microvirga makkahensis TaxID=1128670 RepID=A0A7X3MP52_9HYPH|nr:hypothetical protein [Microvirga makkahensis]MXQ10631.1 hypothetical protein [Microvirga makkahensis]